MSRSVDGDTVAVCLLEKQEWSGSSEVVLEDEGYDPGDTLEKDKAIIDAAAKSKDVQPTGKVVGIGESERVVSDLFCECYDTH